MNSKARYKDLLKRHGCSDSVTDHCTAVSKKALELSDICTISIDKETVYVGAMLHDIGRGRTHGIEHATIGSQIVRNEGFSDHIADIVERHIGAGISSIEAESLGIPVRSYVPQTPEEVIVSFADNLTKGSNYLTYPEALQRFKERLGGTHPAVDRFIRQHERIQEWINKS